MPGRKKIKRDHNRSAQVIVDSKPRKFFIRRVLQDVSTKGISFTCLY